MLEQPHGHVVSESFADHNRRALAGESVVLELPIDNANEEDLLREVRLARLPSGESDGRLLRASFIDTMQRKHAEEKLRLANTFLRVRSRARRTAFLSLKPSAG